MTDHATRARAAGIMRAIVIAQQRIAGGYDDDPPNDPVALIAAALNQAAQEAKKVWPQLNPPPMYEHPDPAWEDTKTPDLTVIWRLARDVGYAVGLHGSLKRDMDLIAAPWTDDAVGNWDLVEHLCAGLPATRIAGPEHKPHGRVAVALQIEGYYKPIDLSIVPKLQAAQPVWSKDKPKQEATCQK